MTEYQVTFWRELPSLVTARDGDDVAKVLLPARFQEAIDEAATRLGETGATEYLEGWRRADWSAADGDPATVATSVAEELERRWNAETVTSYLDSLATAAGS